MESRVLVVSNLDLSDSVCSSGDELVLTEMLFNGVFNDLTVAQCVALCSCFVITENVKEDLPKLTKELAAPYKIMQVSCPSQLRVSQKPSTDS